MYLVQCYVNMTYRFMFLFVSIILFYLSLRGIYKMSKDSSLVRNRKVDLENLIELAINRFEAIESWNKAGVDERSIEDFKLVTKYKDSKGKIQVHEKNIKAINRPSNGHLPSIKRKQLERLATLIKKSLNYDNKSVKNAKIALTTYIDYLSTIRMELVKSLKIQNPDTESFIEDLIKQYGYESVLSPILKADALGVKDAKYEAMNTLENDHSVNASKVLGKLRYFDTDHPFIGKFKPSEAETNKRKKNLKTNKIDRNHKVKVVNARQIKYITNECLDSDDFYELVLGVAFATGRRAIEVIHVSEFGHDVGDSGVSIQNLAKKRDLGKSQEVNLIPTEYDAERIVKAVDKLRSSDRYLKLISDLSDHDESKHNDIINRRVANGLNRLIKSKFEDDEMMFKDSRGLAGKMAYSKFGSSEKFANLSEQAFLQEYFVHDLIEQVTDYGHFKIDFDAPYTPAPTEKVNNVVRNPDLSALEAITNELETINMKGIKPVVKLHYKVIDALKNHGGFSLSKSSIYKGKKIDGELVKIGGSALVIDRYLGLEVVSNAIGIFHKSNQLKIRR